MKKALVLVLALVASLILAQAFSDVPVNHWAYEAVTQLAKLGIISGMPDGTFQGNNPMTRYQVAVALKRMLDYLTKQLAAGPADMQTALRRISALEDLVSTAINRTQRQGEQLAATDQTLQTVLAEISTLKSTIVEISQVRRDLPTMIAASENKMMTMYNQLSAKVSAIEKNVSDLQAQISAQIMSQLRASVDAVNARVSDLDTKFNNLSSRLDTLSKSIDATKSDLTALSKRVDGLESNLQALATLRKSFSDLEGRVAMLETKVASDVDSLRRALETTSRQFDARLSLLEGQVASLVTDVERLKRDVADAASAAKKVGVLEGNVGALAGQLTSLSQRVSQTEQNVANLSKKIDAKPWMSDIEAATVELANKINEAYNIGLIGIIVGAAGAVIGLLGMLMGGANP
ncbi:S-layer homology domain-containing protein [Pseudothermotoga sp.]